MGAVLDSGSHDPGSSAQCMVRVTVLCSGWAKQCHSLQCAYTDEILLGQPDKMPGLTFPSRRNNNVPESLHATETGISSDPTSWATFFTGTVPLTGEMIKDISY